MFLNPWLLSGVALALVPVLIHLLMRRRYRTIPWAAMAFLLEALKKNRQQMEFHDRILMLLRAAAVACLALALARPTLTGRAAAIAGAGSNAMVILIDVSGSMGCHDGRETRLDAARRVVKSLLAQAEPNTNVAVLAFAHDVRMPLGEPTRNLAFLDQELDHAILQTDAETRLDRAVSTALELLRSRSDLQAVRREVYLLTDLQAYPWDERHAAAQLPQQLEELSREASVVLVDVGDASSGNVAVTGLEISDPLVRVGVPVDLSVTVRNFGRAPVANLSVDFYVDVEPGGAPSARLSVDLEAGGRAVASFQTQFPSGGEHRVEARLGPDRVTGDNRCYAVVEVQAGASVLLVDGSDAHGNDPQESETAYLELALAPPDAGGPRRESTSADVVPAYRLNERNFGDYQAVMLCNVSRISVDTALALARQVRAGMGLLILPGGRTDAEQLNGVLGPGGVDLLPADIGETWGREPEVSANADGVPRLLSRDPDRLAHPVMSEFRGEDLNELLAPVRINRGWDLVPHANDNVQTVVAYLDGTPAIMEYRVGLGVVMLAGFPATTAWSNLPTQYVFPVLIPRLASRLAAGQRPSRNRMAGELLSGSLSAGERQHAIFVHPPAPEGRRQATVEEGDDKLAGRLRFQYTETERAGFYEVVPDRPGSRSFAFAVSPSVAEESDLARIAEEDLRTQYPGFAFTRVTKDENVVSRLAAERRGVEVWPWFLGLVFVFLGCESVLALRWAPRE
jgi:hypothetical protein